MAGRLVTIATFDQAAQAHVAKNVLEAAGIQAAITDEEMVSMLWSVSNAVGGVKVKVLEEDAERAVAVLENELGPDEGGEIDPEQLAAEAEAAAPEAGDEQPPAPKPLSDPGGAPTPATDEIPPPSERDEYARRAFFTAWLGLVLLPVALIALYFFLKAALGTGPLSARGRYNLFVGGLLTLGAICLSSLICAGFGGVFR